RDGKLRVRFEADRAGESERPLVTSGELTQKSATQPSSVPSVAAPIVATTTATTTTKSTRTNGESTSSTGPAASQRTPLPLSPVATPPLAAAPVVVDHAALDESRRTVARLERDLRDARETLDAAEKKIDASLQAIYDRDVKIARLEAEVAANAKVR